ncbi:hypothetical protein [Pantoea vagans]
MKGFLLIIFVEVGAHPPFFIVIQRDAGEITGGIAGGSGVTMRNAVITLS